MPRGSNPSPRRAPVAFALLWTPGARHHSPAGRRGRPAHSPVVRLVGELVEPVHLPGTLSRGSDPERTAPEADDLRAIGRGGRRTDDLAARMDRLSAQLGLPLLLAP